jgi:hypothetical protein
MFYCNRHRGHGPRAGAGSAVLGAAALLLSIASASIAAATPSYRVLHIFTNGGDGSAPMAGVQANGAGELFGTTAFGGAKNLGTVFTLQRPPYGSNTWREKVIFSFNGVDGSLPSSALSINKHGQLIGSATGSAKTIFRLNPPVSLSTTWTENVIFSSTTVLADGDLLVLANGNILGVTQTGGVNSAGTVFSVAPSTSSAPGKETDLITFDGFNDFGAQGGLVPDGKGNFLGSTFIGGVQFGVAISFSLSRHSCPQRSGK